MAGTPHNIWAAQEPFCNLPAGVCMANCADDCYSQCFETRDELETFIAELRKAADEVWPNPESQK